MSACVSLRRPVAHGVRVARRLLPGVVALVVAASFLAGGHAFAQATATKAPEVTVDPKTVELPRKVTGVTVPKTAAPLTPGTANYKVKMEMGGQEMEMTTSAEIKADGDTWLVTESAKTPMGAGDVVDRTVLDKDTLTLKKRVITQPGRVVVLRDSPYDLRYGTARVGSMAIEFEVAGDKATGQMKMGEQSRPISADLGGPLFADGAGAYAVIATLPLAEGYTTAFRNFDIQSQKVITKQLKVVGVESVAVAAGTFDAYKTEITSDDGAKVTVWVSRPDRKVVKIVATSPRMNGATLTSELQ